MEQECFAVLCRRRRLEVISPESLGTLLFCFGSERQWHDDFKPDLDEKPLAIEVIVIIVMP